MNTRLIDARGRAIEDAVRAAADILINGGLVALPTETVYGLTAIATDPRAVAEIYRIKGRPAEKPLSLLVSGADAFKYWDNPPDIAYALAERFWPGPLTMVSRRSALVPDIVCAGGETVGLRCPRHDVTLSIIKTVGLPLAAPSANISGRPSSKEAQEVMNYLGGRIDAVVDGGRCATGVESTVLDLTMPTPVIVRQGGLPWAEIKEVIEVLKK